jgi:hypothetical protein
VSAAGNASVTTESLSLPTVEEAVRLVLAEFLVSHDIEHAVEGMLIIAQSCYERGQYAQIQELS